MNENEISKIVVDAAFKIHKEFGPGMFESVYEELLFDDLVEAGLDVERQVSFNLQRKGKKYEKAFN